MWEANDTDFLRRTWTEIDINAILNNFRTIKTTCNKKVFAVVKADAYGHGAKEVAIALKENGVDAFAVSNIVEAEELRAAGITLPILILGYTPVELADRLAKSDIAQCVFCKEYAENLNQSAESIGVQLNVHIKLDTGMGRIGFDCRTDELKGLDDIKDVLKLSNLTAEGIFTHFAVADSLTGDDKTFTREQEQRFQKTVSLLEHDGHTFKVRHCENSAATLSKLADSVDAVRAGIILYGLTPDPEFPLPEEFKSAMSLYSVVSQVKMLDAEQTVSYGRKYKSVSKRKIATVSAGYADGVPRLLSNKGYVMIDGKRAPIVGTVCMDQFCVDVTDIDNVKEGDTVTIFGNGIAVEEVAKNAQTINYEIVCGISKRVPKVYI